MISQKTQSGSSWISRNNINIHAFGISWQTTKFQGFFEAFANEVNTRRYLLCWFCLGTLLTAFLIPCAFYFLLTTLYYHAKSHEDHAGGLIFEPVVSFIHQMVFMLSPWDLLETWSIVRYLIWCKLKDMPFVIWILIVKLLLTMTHIMRDIDRPAVIAKIFMCGC